MIMSKESSKQPFEIRSRAYEYDPNSHEKWFDIWVGIAKKELLDHFENQNSDKKD